MFNNALMVCDFLNRECSFSCIKGKQKTQNKLNLEVRSPAE